MNIHDGYDEDDAVCPNERKTRLIWWAFTLNITLEIFIFGECYNVATHDEDNYEEDGRQG